MAQKLVVIFVNEKSGKDEEAFETKIMILYKNVFITLLINLRQKGGGAVPRCLPPPPGYATGIAGVLGDRN